jgi:hypothetical protein
MAEKTVIQPSISKRAKDIITAPIPNELIQEREGGGGVKLSYISGSTVTDLLNYAFNYMWDWNIIMEWIEAGKPYWNKYKKDSNGKTAPGFEEQGSVAHVKGRLTVHFRDDETGELVTIVKEGYGSKSIIGKQSEQESIFKAAGTDALKKAASLLGIGLELYRDDNEQSFFDAITYDNPWTEETMNKYAAEREFLKGFMEQYELGAEDMAVYVAEFSGDTLISLDDIVPDNITAFADWIKAKVAAAGKGKE